MNKNLLLIVTIVILFGVGGFFVWKVLQSEDTQLPDNTVSVEENPEEVVERLPFPEEFLNDQDQDGLTAEEEAALGTSDVEWDTDGDGISDFDEVNEWNTDPTKADTDGDGFNDLFEIINGYNPLGEGELAL